LAIHATLCRYVPPFQNEDNGGDYWQFDIDFPSDLSLLPGQDIAKEGSKAFCISTGQVASLGKNGWEWIFGALSRLNINIPYIDTATSHWMIFDPEKDSYVDTGISASGKDVFETWKAIPGNEDKTVEEFFDSLRDSTAVASMSGDDITATHNTAKPFYGLTVNQYADLAPGAWVGTEAEFNGVQSVSRNDGTYFVKEEE